MGRDTLDPELARRLAWRLRLAGEGESEAEGEAEAEGEGEAEGEEGCNHEGDEGDEGDEDEGDPIAALGAALGIRPPPADPAEREALGRAAQAGCSRLAPAVARAWASDDSRRQARAV
ncbi:MAG: hypothetical protein HY906_19245, partial [Deltaproteobacteria bacterium]|nr:hypothetical protein [Deltaproteobacteria bacterium]